MKRRLKLFLRFRTVLILAYASIFVILSEDSLRSLHEEVVPLQYVGVALGLFDNDYLQDENYEIKKNIKDTLGEYVRWKNAGESSSNSENEFILQDPRTDIELYSPLHTFRGIVTDNVQQIRITLSHKGRELVKTREVEFENGEREHVINFQAEMIFAGENVYLFEAIFEDGQVIERKVVLRTNFQRLDIGKSTLFLDPHYIPQGEDEDILWSAVDFDSEETHFITWGCDEADPKPKILFQHDVQYKELPACLSFSRKKNYLVWFTPEGVWENGYLYDVHSPDDGVILESYPLYRTWLGRMYYTLVFREKKFDRVATLFAKGDKEQYVMRIERFNTTTKEKELQVVVTDGNQLVVENQKQKMYVYLYKQRSRYTSLVFPGNRYQYFIKGRNDSRSKVNEGSLYSLPIGIYAPRRGYASTFDFSITLDGDTLLIDDSVKITSFNVNQMGTTLDVQDREYRKNDPNVCRNASAEIYKNLLGNQDLGISHRDVPYLVGRGWNASSIKIYHNGKSTGSDPDQLYKGYIHYRLGSGRGNYEKGENTYLIKAYDTFGNEICSKRVSMETRD